jgi:hypothetical protein
MSDPEDTIPPPPRSEPPPPRPITRDRLADEILDARAQDLAGVYAMQRRRGHAIEDLVGIVCSRFRCGAKVLRRADVEQKLGRSETGAALLRAGSRPGRLTVAVCAAEGCVTRHVAMPVELEAPDPGNLLGPMPARTRAYLEERITDNGAYYGDEVRKESVGAALDEMVVHFSQTYGFRRAAPGHEFAAPVDASLMWEKHPGKGHVDEARLDIWPGRVLFLVAPDERYGDTHWSALWVDPRRLGFGAQEIAKIEQRCFDLRPGYQLVS